MLDVFISHSAKDAVIAEALIALLRSSLSLPADHIRCTSVDGYRLPAGVSTEERLRQEVHEARTFIGLITRDSLQSAYVLFELGARWGAGRQLVPLLAAGTMPNALVGPLSGLNALSCGSDAQIHQLVADIGQALEIRPGIASSYLPQVAALRSASEERVKADAPLVMILEPFVTGEMVDRSTGERRAMITIPVTIVNEGTRTITPEVFHLTVDVAGNAIPFVQTVIPPGVAFESERQLISIPKANEWDLTGRIGSLLPGQATTGLLMFSSDAIGNSEVQRMHMMGGLTMSASCTDVRGLMHSVLIVRQPSNVPGAAFKLGITVAPRSSASAGRPVASS